MQRIITEARLLMRLFVWHTVSQVKKLKIRVAEETELWSAWKQIKWHASRNAIFGTLRVMPC